MTEDERVDQMAADQQAFDDMMAETRARRLVADITDAPEQPTVTDFTKIEQNKSDHPFDGLEEFNLSVKLDSGWRVIASHPTEEDAELAELAISQAMIEYRTKRNAWESS
jgi:hypothetical protein